MSTIEDLLLELSPNGVTLRAFAECCNLTAGDRIIKSMMNDNFDYPVMGGGVEPTGKYGKYNFENAITISRAGSAGFVNWMGEKFWATDVCFVASNPRPDVLIKYLFYFIKNHENELRRHLYGGSMPKLNKKYLWSLPIPIPPLSVQEELVAILDNFTQLEMELSSELMHRKLQFQYYREKVLAFDNAQVSWLALDEIGEFIRGKRFTKEDYVADGIDVIHYGEIYTYYGTYANSVKSHVRKELGSKLRYAFPGDVIITDVGETVEDVGKAVAWLGDSKVAIHDHCYAFRHNMNPEFVSYYMQTSQFRADKAKYIARTKVNTLLIKGFAKIKIPVPPLAEQEKIVSALGKFDELINNKEYGLPAEIRFSHKQYEYYRNRLLTFQGQVA
jgi:type I restriction enzyme S subunit